MAAKTPSELVDDFKKSGEFDRLRRELLNSFRNGDGMSTLVSRVEEIAKTKLASEHNLQHMPEALAVRELMQELERYPLIERAVADVPALTDPTFVASLHQHVTSILLDERSEKTTLYVTGSTSSRTAQNETSIQSDNAGTFHNGSAAAIHPDFASLPLALPEERSGPAALPVRTVVTDTTLNVSNSNIPAGPDSPDSAMLESPLTEAGDHPPEPDAVSLLN